MAVISREQPLSPFGDAIAGSIGAVFANAVVYPLDIIKTRLQVQRRSDKEKQVSLESGSSTTAGSEAGQHYEGPLDALQKMVKSEGLSGLYAGMAGGLVGTASQNFAYFYWYTFVRDAYTGRVSPIIGTGMELILGALAGALATIFTIPIAVCTTRQQTASIARRKSLFKTASEVISEDGITGLWRGLKPSLVLCVNPAITYGLFAILKKRVLPPPGPNGKENKLTPGQAFVIGILTKSVATIVTYPYIMAKVRMQHKDEDPILAHAQKDLSAIGILTKIFKEDGFGGLYKGMNTQISKAVMTQAILFYFREIATKYTVLAYALLRQLKANKLARGVSG